MSTKIQDGNGAGYLAGVNSNKQQLVVTETDATGKPEFVGADKNFSEVDSGRYTGVYDLRSAETDDDYRKRISNDNILDYDTLRVAAQNTSKHTFTFTTMAATITTAGVTTNSGSVNTTNIGLTFGTFAMFPIHPLQTLVCETSVSFVEQPASGIVVDFGMFQRGTTPLFAPSDGAYFRIDSAGVRGVINSNGAEQQTEPFTIADGTTPWTYTDNVNYRFLIQITNQRVTFWVSSDSSASIDLLGQIDTPSSLNYPFYSQSIPWSFRHANIATAGSSTFRCIFTDYKVTTRGSLFADDLGVVQSRVLGTYQGLTGGTLGQLIAGTVTSGTLVKPTAAIPVNTSLAANLPNSLGGRIYEQLTGGLAANVDGIFASYTVPAGTAAVQGKRLKVFGIKLSGMVSTVVVGGGAYTEWYVAFGHTADSLATTQSASMASATTKAPVRVMLPDLTTNMGAAQAAGTLLVQPAYYSEFQAPIYVNPGERIALVGNKTIISAITSGVLSYTYQFIYTWE